MRPHLTESEPVSRKTERYNYAVSALLIAGFSIGSLVSFFESNPLEQPVKVACRDKGAYMLGDILDPEAPDNYVGSPLGDGYVRNEYGIAIPDADYGEAFWQEGQNVSGYYVAPDGCYYPINAD